MRKVLFFLPLLLFMSLGLMFYKQLGSNPEYMPSALVGQSVPSFQLTSLQSGLTLDTSSLPKQSYLINFWATWCPSCDIEYPFLMTLAKQGVPIVGIDYKDNKTKATQWLKDKGNPYHSVLMDTEGKFGIDMGVTGAPETFVVNSQGVIVYRYQGVMDDAVWSRIKGYLK